MMVRAGDDATLGRTREGKLHRIVEPVVQMMIVLRQPAGAELERARSLGRRG